MLSHSDVITSRKNGVKDDASDPNALYPELPPNHPESARVLAWPPISRCPVENGVIKTQYARFWIDWLFFLYLHVL